LLANDRDPLAEKMKIMRDKLSSNIGKTGNSITGIVTTEQCQIAYEQTNIAKEIMLRHRGKRGK